MTDVGRPTTFKEEYIEQVYKLCLLGATDVEMSDFFGCSKSTFNLWKKKQPKFSDSIHRGKLISDAEVAEKLREKALGYSHKDMHVSSYEGNITLTPITKHYAPDTQAASLWLRNRQPDKWRDKQEHNVGFDPNAPLVLTVNKTVRNARDNS